MSHSRNSTSHPYKSIGISEAAKSIPREPWWQQINTDHLG